MSQRTNPATASIQQILADARRADNPPVPDPLHTANVHAALVAQCTTEGVDPQHPTRTLADLSVQDLISRRRAHHAEAGVYSSYSRATAVAAGGAYAAGGGGGGGTPYLDEVLNDSPVGVWLLNEPSGTIAYDNSGARRDGTIAGTPTLSSAGVSFDGVDDEVSLGDLNSLLSGNSYTAEMWVTYDANVDHNSSKHVLFQGKDRSSGNPYNLVTGSTTSLLTDEVLTVGSGGYRQGVLQPLSLTGGTEYHIVVVSDGTDHLLYVDGTLQSTTKSGAWVHLGFNNVELGHVGGTGGGFYGGHQMRRFALYDTALSAARILAHYNTGAAEATDPYSEPTLPTSPMTESGFGTGVLGNTTDFPAWGSNNTNINSPTIFLDELAIYTTALSSTRVQAHRDAASSAAYESAVLADSPTVYHRLNETVADSDFADSGAGGHTLDNNNNTVGVGATGVWDEGAEFHTSWSSMADYPSAVRTALSTESTLTIECFFRTGSTTINPNDATIFSTGPITGDLPRASCRISTNSNGYLVLSANPGGAGTETMVFGGLNVYDTLWRHLVAVFDAGTWTLYLEEII